jgi:hypothetical protein
MATSREEFNKEEHYLPNYGVIAKQHNFVQAVVVRHRMLKKLLKGM